MFIKDYNTQHMPGHFTDHEHLIYAWIQSPHEILLPPENTDTGKSVAITIS